MAPASLTVTSLIVLFLHCRVSQALYCGFSSAALLSCLVGAVHYVSFCVSKRAAQSMGAASSAAAAVSTAATSSAGSSDGAAGKAADKVRKAAGKAAGAAAAASTDAGAADSGSGSAAGSSGGGSGLSLHDIHGHTAEVEGTVRLHCYVLCHSTACGLQSRTFACKADREPCLCHLAARPPLHWLRSCLFRLTIAATINQNQVNMRDCRAGRALLLRCAVPPPRLWWRVQWSCSGTRRR